MNMCSRHTKSTTTSDFTLYITAVFEKSKFIEGYYNVKNRLIPKRRSNECRTLKDITWKNQLFPKKIPYITHRDGGRTDITV